MSFGELLFIAIGLSMDAFAVSICKGLSLKKVSIFNASTVGLWFGGFQALMPLIGFYLCSLFSEYIQAFDHWVSFGLLALIGINMIRESLKKDDEEDTGASLGIKAMLPLALATSIDALAVGVTFALEQIQIYAAILLIGVITFILSAIGVKVGNVFGAKYKSKAEFAGGIILIFLGLKILVEDLNLLEVL